LRNDGKLVIKDSRDVQKLSKLAVYAVIRGHLDDAKRKLHDAAIIANKILSTVSTVIPVDDSIRVIVLVLI